MKVHTILLLLFSCFNLFSILNGLNNFDSSCPVSMGHFLPQDELIYHNNGDLLYKNKIYNKNQYWKMNNSTFICVCNNNNNGDDDNNKNPCIRKCCMNDEYLENTDKPKCIKSTSIIASIIQPSNEQLSIDFNNKNISSIFKIINNRYCPDKMIRLMPDDSPDDNWILNTDGSIYAIDKIFNQSSYCIDWTENYNTITALICIELTNDNDNNESRNKLQDIVYPIGILLSVPFLIATLIVYSMIPELKNLYGKTLMCYVGCLIVAFCLLFCGRLVYFGSPLCTGIAFSIYFSFLASFFWLNVMCFDIWWTFGGLRSLPGSVKQREKKKFIYYSLYAWGLASILTGICLIADLVPGLPNYLIKPKFGNQKCWFVDEVSKAVYFYGPMGITVICNIILFISTALKIRQHKKNTSKQLGGMDSRRHDANKQWFNLYLKLFIVMGINWSMEIISWMEKGKEYLGTLYFIFDLANALQGVIIFIIFVWKDKIKRSLLKKIGWNDKLNSQSHTSTRNHSSSSRTTTTMLPLQDKTIKINNNKEQLNCLTTDESDCL
ncbi:hypothetical protein HCN44_004616 [Aphidius gifuensis]|uniref:G-protein coupled receptors family 2 profile 2 domain-containing protein n=1 Tax=Aphidius gifuensis TaxID=684658 RepID=A0A835CSM2_APHGI|nr:G-protein coupled receptor Mth2-like isoform X3 [Aphidius gifuensis]KAF7995144.1 hypothetical protein HCN44_004616 [Aphidius gifuensis]